ncbi:MAG: response regulator, partial [Verrucomicrobiia bacterium]
KVLIIEDEEPFVKEVRKLLQREGYETIEATTVEQAQQKLTQQGQQRISIALVDMRLRTEREAGLKLIELMRKESPWIVPIVLTGYAEVSNVGKCMRAGAFQYLCKDVCCDELLLMTVKQAADQFSLLTAVYELLKQCDQLQACISGVGTCTSNVRKIARGLEDKFE